MRFKSQNLQPADCDSIRNPQAAIPIISDPSYKPATHWLRFKSRLWFQSQNLHPAGCDSIRNLQVAIPVPKPASRRLRFNSQPASCDSSPKSLQPAGCDSLRGCDSIPKTCIPQVTIQFATCTPQGCKLRLPIISDPSYKACNPQVAIRVEVAIPVPKPASRRLRFNSQPASCDSSPKTCIPQVAIQFATCKLRFQSLPKSLQPTGCDSIRNLQVAIPVPKACNPHRLRFTSRLWFQSNLHPAGCELNAIQFATCTPQGCDSIRNLQVAIPCPKPASRRLRFNSQPAIQFATCNLRNWVATCKLRFQSLPKSLQPTGCDSSRGCDSSPKTCIPQVAIPIPIISFTLRKLVLIYFGFLSFLLRIQLYLACFASLLQTCLCASNGWLKWMIWGYLHVRKPPYGCWSKFLYPGTAILRE